MEGISKTKSPEKSKKIKIVIIGVLAATAVLIITAIILINKNYKKRKLLSLQDEDHEISKKLSNGQHQRHQIPSQSPQNPVPQAPPPMPQVSIGGQKSQDIYDQRYQQDHMFRQQPGPFAQPPPQIPQTQLPSQYGGGQMPSLQQQYQQEQYTQTSPDQEGYTPV